MTKVKYTNLRSNVFWFHLKIPAAIYNQTTLASTLIRYSLNTSAPDKAEPIAQLLAYKVKVYLEQSEPSTITKCSIRKLIEATLQSIGEKKANNEAAIKPTRVPTLSEAFASYRAEVLRAQRWRAQTQYDNEMVNRTFIELVGDMPVNEITVEVCRTYRDMLLKYPVQRTKNSRLANKSIAELLKGENQFQTFSLTTVNNHLRRTATFLNWLNDQGYNVVNPLHKMKIKQKQSLKSFRAPFEDKDLISIHSSNIFTKHNFAQDYYYWLPLLGLYTGARIEEICQLHLADINFDCKIPYISIDDEHQGQHIKSESSRRQIPIHHQLIDLGFERFIKQKRLQKEIMLFGYLIPQRNKYGHQPSRWFGRLTTKLDIKDKRKVYHSYRHTMAERLREVRARDYEIKALLGHSSGSVTHDVYGSDQTAIESINLILQQLDFSHVISDIKPWS